MLLSNENDVQTTFEKKYPFVDHLSCSPLVGAYFLTLANNATESVGSPVLAVHLILSVLVAV